MATKRKAQFRDEFCDLFSGIKRSKKGVYFASCTICPAEIDLGNTGKAALSLHCNTKKHRTALGAKNASHSIISFGRSDSPADYKTAATEGTFAYHIVKHHQSFHSADCINRLIP